MFVFFFFVFIWEALLYVWSVIKMTIIIVIINIVIGIDIANWNITGKWVVKVISE